ncbi:jg485 [Pararge aegeria aegeria]|uniref:Jg485 protein n=1 Tax=Pararge aegeria aegeria TaxID=348720 RepID=A0A8S4QY53_9NEOP|nr:jg485 [Pararge aegeria aegeria]
MTTILPNMLARYHLRLHHHLPPSEIAVKDKTATAGSIISKLGWAGVWKGLGPRIVMIGTLTALQWFIYDAVKVYLRMPRPPPAEMPESMRKRLEAEAAKS